LALDVYDTDSLNRLPASLDPSYVSTVTRNDVFAFFGENCPLSNFHSAPFKCEGQTYRHVEEYLFVKKAEFANDDSAKHRILKASTPADCKQIGKGIVVDRKKWQSQEIAVMTKALFEKFNQNQIPRDYLKKTGNKTLAEVSPTDRFWGIGMSLGKVASSNQLTWTGKNKLGELLMDLRSKLT
jgi:ribA/ribD-fused uncharacterized protein